jgi:hypothetical protein
MQAWNVEALIGGAAATECVLLCVVLGSWVITGSMLLKVRRLKAELRVAKERGDVRRWISSGQVRNATADVLERHGLLALMTPGMANALYISLEASLGEEMEAAVHYSEWERLCDDGAWNSQAVGKGK